MSFNPKWALDSVVPSPPLWAALIAEDGGGVVPFLINPRSIKSNLRAETVTHQIYQSDARTFWLGNGPTNYTFDLLLTGGLDKDVRPIIESLKSAVGGSWRYVHGSRATPPLIITSASFTESRWIGGIPVKAEGSLQGVTIGPSANLIVIHNSLTLAESNDIVLQAQALGFRDVSVDSNGLVSANGVHVGDAINGTFVQVT